jgi:plasmid maintenance system antidote protein VapI
MLTPNGNTSAKVAPGRSFKRTLRMELICRLEMQGCTEDEIAFSQGITKVRVNQIKRTPEYIALRMSLYTGVVADANRDMFSNLQDNRDAVKDIVPDAMQAIKDAIYDKSQPALRLKAAQDFLDREGSFVKVSKTEVKKTVLYDFDQHERVSEDLLSILQQGADKSLDFDELGIGDFSQNAADVKSADANLQKAFDLIDAVNNEKKPTIN